MKQITKRQLKLMRRATELVGFSVLASSAMVYKMATGFSDKQKMNGQQAAIQQNHESDNDWYQNLPEEQWQITTEDGLHLVASYVHNPAANGKVVILAHGLHHSREQVRPYARLFYQLGYSLVMPDARAHGLSEGNVIGLGWLDRSDYLGWIDELIRRRGATIKIVLFGISMGATTVMAVSGEQLPTNVAAIIEDSGYSNVYVEGKYRLGHKYHFPTVPMVSIASRISKLRDGYAFEDGDIIRQVQHNHLPILMIHGARDQTVPVKNVFQLYHEANQPKKLYVEPEAGHIETIYVNPTKYRNVVTEFLAQIN